MSWLQDFFGFTSSLPNLFETEGFVVVVVVALQAMFTALLFYMCNQIL
jgi:hypothetical protein